MKSTGTFLLTLLALYACSQSRPKDKPVGGLCEGCEAISEYGASNLSASTILPDFNEPGPKLRISGTVYQKDGKTPAANVILYVYHTNQKGIYEANTGAQGWEKRHGSIRGWVKTEADGKYSFSTLLPASYPNSDNPKHIHPVIKEPGLQAYWIDEFVFDDDPLLTPKQRSSHEERGGSGVLRLTNENGILIGKRDIILGKNIPGY